MTQTPPSQAYPHLLESRDLRTYWMLRILFRLDAIHDMHESFRTLARSSYCRALVALGIAVESDVTVEDWKAIMLRLHATYAAIESRRKTRCFAPVLEANLALLRRRFGFTVTECRLIGFAVLLNTDDAFEAIARRASERLDIYRLVADAIGSPLALVTRALMHGSRLRRSHLVMLTASKKLPEVITVGDDSMRKLAISRLHCVDDLFADVLKPASPPELARDDFPHLIPAFDEVVRLLRRSLDKRRAGTNVLLHGVPGTGKSQLCRVLARAVGAELFEVSSRIDHHLEKAAARQRLEYVQSAQFVLRGKRAMLCFDEIDAIFRFGSSGTGPASIADQSKAWLNELLETNVLPTIWVANDIDTMDPAFVRRFDLVIRLDAPPQAQRLRLLERECAEIASPELLRRISRIEHITPALVTRASRTVRCMREAPGLPADALLEAVLDGVVQAQGHVSLRRSLARQAGEGFDPALCNASENLADVMQGIRRIGEGRICLHGPPGTGKSAFGHWLARELGRPLVLKKVSDLQSPWLGETERNIARAFERAGRDGAVLQIDEVDSFLRDRRHAQRSWELAEVNEFLAQLEIFEGIFIASTNLMEELDQAALRRFDYKIRMDYLRREQAEAMLVRTLRELSVSGNMEGGWNSPLERLTPGDFAVVARKHRITPFATGDAVIRALVAEQACRDGERRRIGFV